ncbi:MAG: 50S ribosomal protein L30 [Alphaproteobacteria bacterium]|nr:50S ribosomal protein L30 [Alphaproteobacteria bacterium]
MNKIKVTQIKSSIDQSERQKKNLLALGLKKISGSNELTATPQILGIVNKVKHLVKIHEIN